MAGGGRAGGRLAGGGRAGGRLAGGGRAGGRLAGGARAGRGLAGGDRPVDQRGWGRAVAGRHALHRIGCRRGVAGRQQRRHDGFAETEPTGWSRDLWQTPLHGQVERRSAGRSRWCYYVRRCAVARIVHG
ncbi:hypothetical protein D3H59_28280 [Micromonospora endophytica]|nr:hypothetical protein D3H59_28280 [Micromonospora endophytica]